MRRFIPTTAAALLIAAGSALAQHTEAPPAAPPASAAFTTLMEAHEGHEVKSRAEAKARYELFKTRFETFAEEHEGTADEVRARLWLIRSSHWLRQEGTMETEAAKIADDLLKRHADSSLLEELRDVQYAFAKEDAKRINTKLLDSPHAAVRAAGHLSLAGRRTKTDEQREHLHAIMKDYADVKCRYVTYGAIADARLNPIPKEDLEVGKPAPEIVGVDHQLKPMTLSRYKGRVVLLDFWGDW